MLKERMRLANELWEHGIKVFSFYRVIPDESIKTPGF